MSNFKIQENWIDSFTSTFLLNGVKKESKIAILCESQSQQTLVELSKIALNNLKAKYFLLELPSAPSTHIYPIRSNGSTECVNNYDFLISSLSDCDLVVDCTVEGLLHTKFMRKLIQSGGKVFMISNEHPEILCRLVPDQSLSLIVDKSLELISKSKRMIVKSSIGTNLDIEIKNAPSRSGCGFLRNDDKVAYWPSGLALFFPLPNTVNGTVTFNIGDANLTMKKYFESQVTFSIENDKVIDIHGSGLDAELLRSYYQSWNDSNAYTVSHVGWGFNPKARWEALNFYDKSDINGTELRVFEGNFLFSTGANEFADRFTNCHFDFPMRNCNIFLDDIQILKEGKFTKSFYD